MSGRNYSLEFAQAMDLLLELEGGYGRKLIALPGDPGGETYCGITAGSWIAWRARTGREFKSLAQATQSEVEAFYWDEYWTALHCDRLLWPASAVYFQCAVNLDPVSAMKCLQIAALARPIDGVWGPMTYRSIQTVAPPWLAVGILAVQSAFYAFHPERYEAGLQARVARVHAWLNETQRREGALPSQRS